MSFERYDAQVRLLMQALPYVAKEEVFALKGGTAINLFYRDLPRLSVDIDLTYLPLQPRAESLQGIDEALDRIGADIEANLAGTQARRIAGGAGGDTRVLVRQGYTEIKIETSPVGRGTILPPEPKMVSESVEERYGFAEVPVVAFEELYAGKLVAALDRQHPRDLFDVKLLLENEGITGDLFRAFLIYTACSKRPPHEILDPNCKDITRSFEKEFAGMSADPVTLDELLTARVALIGSIQNKLDAQAKTFLLSLHDNEPDFASIGFDHAGELPAIQWKLHNLWRLKDANPKKHAALREEIERLFE
ncbi:MAG: nucleotidyl transferase AbiEii/AbiGii toxin family protein [Paracoccaceae bacterium]